MIKNSYNTPHINSHISRNQDGFIPMLLGIVLLVIIGIILIFMRVRQAN